MKAKLGFYLNIFSRLNAPKMPQSNSNKPGADDLLLSQSWFNKNQFFFNWLKSLLIEWDIIMPAK